MKATHLEERMMNISQYVDYYNMYIDSDVDFMFINRYWHSINDGVLLCMGKKMIEYMGHTNLYDLLLNYKIAHEKFIKLLSEYTINKDYFKYNDEEYRIFLKKHEEYREDKIYPIVISVDPNSYMLLLTSDAFKHIMISMSDKSARYYLALEKLINQYRIYTTNFLKNEIIHKV